MGVYGLDPMTQQHVLLTFPVLVMPSTIDHVQSDEVVVGWGFLFQNCFK